MLRNVCYVSDSGCLIWVVCYDTSAPSYYVVFLVADIISKCVSCSVDKQCMSHKCIVVFNIFCW